MNIFKKLANARAGVVYEKSQFLQGITGIGKAIANIPSAVKHSPMLWGIASRTKGWGPKLAVPGTLIGGFALYNTAGGLLGAGYDINSPLASWSAYNGVSDPVNTTMDFSGMNWTSMQMGAQGNMAFALHNLRKR